MSFLALPTLAGLEPVLAEELTQLGARNVEPGRRVVTCQGGTDLVYRANLHCRTALRVLLALDEFVAEYDDHLYDRVRATNWRKYLQPEGSLFIQVVDAGRYYRNSHYVAQRVKDAIVDQFRQKYDTRPSVSKKQPDLRIHLHVGRGGKHTLSLDTSGDGLHRRGYRRRGGPAPLNEVLAAGLVALSGYDGERPFVDPMCGSGTIAIEAATLAARRAPGLNRSFGFERWPDFDADLWRTIKRDAESSIRTPPHPIVAADQEAAAVAATRQGAERAGVDAFLTLHRSPFSELARHLRPRPENALLVMNPPYEERMQTGDIEGFYRHVGDALKQDWKGSTAWVLSASKLGLKNMGLKTSRRIPLVNGPLEARFCRYDLY